MTLTLEQLHAATRGVWSERDEPGTSKEYDCVYASILVALYAAGFRRFPLGAYSVNEREKLEASDLRQDNTGAAYTDTDYGTKRRYGLTNWHTLAAGQSLRELLAIPGLAVAVIGVNGRIDYNDPWRRWQRGFTGWHSVTELTAGGGKVLHLDPLATWNFEGDEIDSSVVTKFAIGTAEYVRYMRIGELVQEGSMGYNKAFSPFPALVTAHISAGATVYGYDPDRPGAPVKKYTAPADRGSSFAVQGRETVTFPDAPATIPHGTFLKGASDPTKGGVFTNLLVIERYVQLDPIPQPKAFTQADVDAAKRAGANTAAADVAAEVIKAAQAAAAKYPK
jgi:hypothetical protein